MHVDLNETPMPRQVYPVSVPLPVLPAVVLMDTTGTNQAEVSPCNEIASLVVELRLRPHVNVCGNVQHP